MMLDIDRQSVMDMINALLLVKRGIRFKVIHIRRRMEREKAFSAPILSELRSKKKLF